MDLALITSNWWVEDPNVIQPATRHGPLERFRSPPDALGERPLSTGSRTDNDCYEWEHGLVNTDMFYVACIGNGNGAVRVERYDLTGTRGEPDRGRGSSPASVRSRPGRTTGSSCGIRRAIAIRYDLLTGPTAS